MKKRILLIPTFIFLVGIMILATDRADAFGFGADEDTLVRRLADKFGKDEQEVQVVFDELREERQQQIQARYEDELQEAVVAGLITENQKQLILAKHQENQQIYQDMREELKDMSFEDRVAIMQAQHDEMVTWAEENGIDIAALHFGPGKYGGKWYGCGFHKDIAGANDEDLRSEMPAEMLRMHGFSN